VTARSDRTRQGECASPKCRSCNHGTQANGLKPTRRETPPNRTPSVSVTALTAFGTLGDRARETVARSPEAPKSQTDHLQRCEDPRSKSRIRGPERSAREAKDGHSPAWSEPTQEERCPKGSARTNLAFQDEAGSRRRRR